MSVCHGGNSDDLVSISTMADTVAVNFCVDFNGLNMKKRKHLVPGGHDTSKALFPEAKEALSEIKKRHFFGYSWGSYRTC